MECKMDMGFVTLSSSGCVECGPFWHLKKDPSRASRHNATPLSQVTFGGPHEDEGSAHAPRSQYGASDKHDKQDGHEEGESAQQPAVAFPVRFPADRDRDVDADSHQIKRSQLQPAPHLQQTGVSKGQSEASEWIHSVLFPGLKGQAVVPHRPTCCMKSGSAACNGR